MPIKCPVAPLEFTFLADAFFTEQGMRDRVEITYVTPLEGAFTKASRFADGEGTNPEELVGAAHAGCFSQYLALLLSGNGTPPRSVETTAKVSIVVAEDGPTINRIALSTVVVQGDRARMVLWLRGSGLRAAVQRHGADPAARPRRSHLPSRATRWPPCRWP